MPWKEGYTTSDEKSLADQEVRWPDSKQCACVIVIDLSVASGPAGITAADLTTAASQFGTQVGLPSLLAMLQRFSMTATFPSRRHNSSAARDKFSFEAALRSERSSASTSKSSAFSF